MNSNAPHGANVARLRRPVTSPDEYRVALKSTGKRKEVQKMKYGKLSAERRRTFTLDITEIDHEMVRDSGNGTYTYGEYAARKALLENQVFQWDCAAFGFPDDMIVHESDSPDVFDIDVFWRN